MSNVRRFLNLFRGERISRAIDKEMLFHIEERVDDLVAQGLARFDARTEAERKFGGYMQHKENTWETDLLNWLGSIVTDLRYALRNLAKSPGFAAVAILSLALGIGVNTAIFTLLDAILLRSLPVQHPEELSQVLAGPNPSGSPIFTNPLWEQLRDHQDNSLFQGLYAWSSTRFNTTTSGEARYIEGTWVSGRYFETLGVNAALGRTLSIADDRRGCPSIAVLSHGFWQKEYGGDPGAIGKNLSLEGHNFEITGVARAGFSGVEVGSAADVFLPLCTEAVIHAPQSMLEHRAAWWLSIAGRRKPGVTEAQATAYLNVLAPPMYAATVPPWDEEQQKEYLSTKLSLAPASRGASDTRNEYGDSLQMLMAAVGLVLLIACANVANLQLARAKSREREMAVRLALGARRGRLIRQALTESLLLSLSGAALGLLFAQWGSHLLTALISTTRNPVWLDLAPDWRVLLFTIAAGTSTGVFFGLVPALRVSRVSPNAAMKAQGRGTSEGRAGMHFSKTLVVMQVALSMVLLAGAGLMLRTFRNLTTLDPGFRAEGVLLVRATLHGDRKVQDLQITDILARMRAIPGVRSAASSEITPIQRMRWNTRIQIVGQAERKEFRSAIMFLNAASDDYFKTLGTPIVAGRDFTPRDTATSPSVVIINETAAQKFFGKANPIGHSLRMETAAGYDPPREIIAVVRDAKYQSLRGDAPPTGYIPEMQRTGPPRPPNFELYVGGAMASIIPAVKEAVSAADAKAGIEMIPFTQQLAESITQERMLAMLSTFFGALALLLAAIGLYGVLSYNVVRRRNEIGIRMALGAAQSRVLRMVMSEAGWLAFIGLGLGFAGTLAATQLLKTFLFGLSADDPPTIAASAAMLATVAAVAAYLPARRAAKLDPMVALRDE